MDVQRIKAVGESIQAILQFHTGGWNNIEALRLIEAQANTAAIESGYHHEVLEKVARIKANAIKLYSTRGHEAYNTPTVHGTDRLRALILSDAMLLSVIYQAGPPSASGTKTTGLSAGA